MTTAHDLTRWQDDGGACCESEHNDATLRAQARYVAAVAMAREVAEGIGDAWEMGATQ